MLKMLLEQKRVYEEQIKEIQGQLGVVVMNIEELLATKLLDLRTLQGKETGAVNLMFEGFKITETIPKKVEWDQAKLDNLYVRILEAGDNPRAYMKLKFDIPEKTYAALDPNIQSIFAEARTVKHGKAQLSFEEVTNA